MRANVRAKLADNDRAQIGNFGLSAIVGGMLAILIGVTLVPTIADEVKRAQDNGNVTGASDALVGLLLIIFVIGVLLVGLGILKSRAGG